MNYRDTVLQVLREIEWEQKRAHDTWGPDFDKANTANDWIAYITRYAGMAVTFPFDQTRFEDSMIKAAGLCLCAVVESRRGGPAPRHYDEDQI